MTTTPISLKELERKAFRSTYQDGLLDIYMGGTIASFTVFADTLYGVDSLTSWQRVFIFLVGCVISNLIFWVGKKFITLPRIGQVKFGPARKRRIRTLIIVLSVVVGIQVAIFAFQLALWQIPALHSWFGFLALPQDMGKLVVAVVGALFVGPGFTVMAYFIDFPRGYYIAAVTSLAVFCMIWFENALFYLAAGLLIILPGIFLFIRFLLQHPLPPRELQNG